MMYAAMKTLHVLSIVIWVGGMLFAHAFLRPAAAKLPDETRLRLMHDVLGRFFKVVTVVSVLALFTGYWMMGHVAKNIVQAGGSFVSPLHWTVMAIVGTLMVLLYGHIRFALYGKFAKSLEANDIPQANLYLFKTRKWVLVNLLLGLGLVAFTLLAPGWI
jgi:uncharacterized membrane protein